MLRSEAPEVPLVRDTGPEYVNLPADLDLVTNADWVSTKERSADSAHRGHTQSPAPSLLRRHHRCQHVPHRALQQLRVRARAGARRVWGRGAGEATVSFPPLPNLGEVSKEVDRPGLELG